jgi:hypothetical protein
MLIIVPVTLRQANALVARWHRHHKPVRGCRFCIAAYNTETGKLVGAAIVGRPVARLVNWHSTVEVSRLVADGTKNACSLLYAASARTAREMGFEKIQTYILASETGISLRAAGWHLEEIVDGGKWHHSDSDKPRRQDQPTCDKQRWAKLLNTPKLNQWQGLALYLEDADY